MGALMIACAKRALPGITLSLMMSVSIAVPAMAAADSAVGHGKTEPQPPSHRLSGSARNKSAAKLVQKSVGLASRGHGEARSRLRDISPAAAQSGRAIHRASSAGRVDHTLIDDGTLWREQGSLATWQQTGVASWYGGKRWQGHRTSSGATYDENALTAAHATLPLGTRVRVVSHNGAKSVIVTINDRPGTRNRIIDLSREAAKQLGILDTGVAMVTLQPM
jgi:rare lipoprotein A (peptidoglycan hydrolase)